MFKLGISVVAQGQLCGHGCNRLFEIPVFDVCLSKAVG